MGSVTRLDVTCRRRLGWLYAPVSASDNVPVSPLLQPARLFASLDRSDTMPATLTARTMLWIGIGLITFSVLCQVIFDVLSRAADFDLINEMIASWWYPLYQFVPTVLIPLGAIFVAAFFVANAIERRMVVDPKPRHRPEVPAVVLFWTGVVLTILGLLVNASLQDWLTDLNAQGRTSLALDALNLMVIPLRMVIVPVGLALLPISVLVKRVQALPVTQTSDQTGSQLSR